MHDILILFTYPFTYLGALLSKALTCKIFVLCINKMSIVPRRRIPLAILLYEQFIHLTQITSRSNIQFLSTKQSAYQSFLVTSWFDSVRITVKRWLNCRVNIYMNMNYSYPTIQHMKVLSSKCTNIWLKKPFFPFFSYTIFMKKNVNNTRNTYIWVKIISYISWITVVLVHVNIFI